MFTLLTPLRLALGLMLLYLTVLGLGYGRAKGFLIDEDGTRRPIEYVAVRAAGELAAAGRPADAYDWTAHKARHDQIIGKPHDGYFTWPYPPTFLPVADLLSRLPYVASALLIIVATGAFYAIVAARLVPRGAAYALGAPPTMVNASIAHTGFLVAGLFGLGLARLRSQPLLAGALFGLLAVKPQLGLLLPVALVAGRHWRAIGAAAASATALIMVSLVLYGLAPWLAMPAQLQRVVTDILASGQVNFDVMATLYATLRRFDVAHAVASTLQGVFTVGLAGAVYQLWRSDASDDLKAAGLLTASVLATPYLFIYDLTLLVMAALFLVRAAGPQGLDAVEAGVVLGSGLLLLLNVMIPFPVGFIAALLAAALVVRRALPHRVPAGWLQPAWGR